MSFASQLIFENNWTVESHLPHVNKMFRIYSYNKGNFDNTSLKTRSKKSLDEYILLIEASKLSL